MNGRAADRTAVWWMDEWAKNALTGRTIIVMQILIYQYPMLPFRFQQLLSYVLATLGTTFRGQSVMVLGPPFRVSLRLIPFFGSPLSIIHRLVILWISPGIQH